MTTTPSAEDREKAKIALRKLAAVFRISSKQPPFYEETVTEQDAHETRLVRQVLRSEGVLVGITQAIAEARAEGWEQGIAAVLQTMPHDAPKRWRMRVEALAKKE